MMAFTLCCMATRDRCLQTVQTTSVDGTNCAVYVPTIVDNMTEYKHPHDYSYMLIVYVLIAIPNLLLHTASHNFMSFNVKCYNESMLFINVHDSIVVFTLCLICKLFVYFNFIIHFFELLIWLCTEQIIKLLEEVI